MMRLATAVGVALALLGTAGALLALPRPAEVPVPVPPLQALPLTLGPWSATAEPPPSAIPVDAAAPEHLFRTYSDGARPLWVSVLYYARQGEGNRAPTQSLLFPGHDWTEKSVRLEPLDVGSGPRLPANLLTTRLAGRRYAVMYWYQVGTRTTASDHVYRALILYNRLLHQRTDGALVRVITRIDEGAEVAIVERLSDFVRRFYPELIRTIPQ